MSERVLVLKLGALGNMVLSLGAFAAIRAHHADAEVTLLTTAPYLRWMAQAPYFDRVWIDRRPAWWDVPGWLALRRRLIEARFDRVYDLQTSNRSNGYFRLFPPRRRPEWSGIAAGCSHPDGDPARDRLHDADRQAGQLRQAGIGCVPPADLSWSRADASRFGLPPRYALLVPGSSPHRLRKRWPAGSYRDLAARLEAAGLSPMVLGSAGEGELGRAIGPAARDLTGRTEIADLTELARGAVVAIGNDTGPMHVIATAGCPSVVLFSADSDPALCAPRGAAVRVLRRDALTELSVDEVAGATFSLCAEAQTA